MHRFSGGDYVGRFRWRSLSVACPVAMLAAMLVAVAGCQPDDQSRTNVDAGLSVTEAYYRLPPPGIDKTAAYLKVSNSGAAALTLEAVSSAWVRAIEIHEIVETDGQMRMRRQAFLPLPAKSVVSLEPGGLHLMLFGLSVDKMGEELPLELTVVTTEGQSSNISVMAKPRDLRKP